MTAIAACVHRGRVWMAADTLIWEKAGPLAHSATPKCWKVGAAVIGVAGDWTALVKAHALRPERTVDDYYRAWRELMSEEDDADALLGFAGSIYYLPGPIKYAERIAAIGSGASVSIGALAASQLEGRGRVEQAVRIACRYNSKCGGRVVSACSG